MNRGGRFQALLRLTRFPLLPTAIADSAAGYLIALPAGATPSLRTMAFLAETSACLYTAGMVLNDVQDLERDRTLHPSRPLPSGIISREEAMIGGLFLAALGIVASLFLVSPASPGIAFFLFISILAYDSLLKRWPIPGSLAMGVCRALNMSLGLWAGLWEWLNTQASGGMAVVGTGLGISNPAIILGAYVVLVTFISTFEENRPGAARWVAILLRGIIPLDAAMVSWYGRPLAALGILALLPLALGLRRLLPRHE